MAKNSKSGKQDGRNETTVPQHEPMTRIEDMVPEVETEQEIKVEAPEMEIPEVEKAMSDVDPDPRWPVSTWHEIILAKIGKPSHVLTAAMLGQDLDKDYSEAEVRSLVEKFLNTPAR